MKVHLTGDWDKRKFLIEAPGYIEPVMKKVILRQAHWLRAKMVGKEGIGNPGLAPNSPWTIAKKGSSKPLVASGTLRQSIGVIPMGSGAFVGVRRKAQSKGKKSIVNLAMLHERGASWTVTVTPRMRRFFMAMTMRMYGEVRAPPVGRVLKIKIPARPFISPVLDKYGKESVLMPRIEKDYARLLRKRSRLPWRRK